MNAAEILVAVRQAGAALRVEDGSLSDMVNLTRAKDALARPRQFFFRACFPKGATPMTDTPTFVAKFADGETTRMSVHCPSKLDIDRGVRSHATPTAHARAVSRRRWSQDISSAATATRWKVTAPSASQDVEDAANEAILWRLRKSIKAQKADESKA
jgi:hypothetical protein